MNKNHKPLDRVDEKKKMDDVLSRMLSTPPPKPESKQQKNKTAK